MTTPRLPRRSVQLTRGRGHRAFSRSPHPLIGLAAGDRAIHLTPDAGHVLLSAPAGMGSTTVLRTLGAQALTAGWHVDIVDVHASEHPWAAGLDRVTHVHEPDAVHRHLIGLAHQARGRAAAQSPGPARLVLVENHGTTDVLLNHRVDPRPNGMPLDALVAVLAHGRLARIQVVLACTEPPPALGHILRDLFTTRLLLQPTDRTWRLAGENGQSQPPAVPWRPGLWHHLGPDGPRLLQAADLSDEDAAHLARPAPAATRRRSATRTVKESTR
ncbi:hypothetical protein [Streptomyces sp. NBC_01601]|uniref:hypothetical protein n=1 Tax=Streptomyces sp. NBC_01601 TaxID=2975892 RepID=UPI002E2B9EDA|nr:hypothetical protein [Streptomyces sp. NBC_01601]